MVKTYLKAALIGFLANLKYRLYYATIGDYPSYWKHSMLTRMRGIVHNIGRGRDYRWDAWIH